MKGMMLMRKQGLVNGAEFPGTHIGRSKGKRRCIRPPAAAMLVVLLTVVSVLALQSTRPEGQDQVRASPLAPPPPYLLYGYTFNGDDAAASFCLVNITNEATSDWIVISSDAQGYYQYDLSDLPGAYVVGDMINVSASSVPMYGWNETAVTAGGGMWLNVTLAYEIPEFPALPGMVCGVLVAVVATAVVRRRTSR